MIPEGYRLLTRSDVGKTFGVDLESMVYFNEEVTPRFCITSSGGLNLTNFCEERRDYLPYAEEEISSGIYLYGNTNDYIYFELAGTFWPTEADLSGVEITSFDIGTDWNNWLYVKDIETTDPYNIKIKNKEGIKLITKDKDIHFNDDVKITIDESLLGGEGESLEEYDGSWESAGGFTAIFAETYATHVDYVSYYSLDNGTTWENANNFVYNKLELDNITQIKFKVTYEFIQGYEVYAGGKVVCEELGVDIEATSSNREIVTENFILTQNINVSMGSAA